MNERNLSYLFKLLNSNELDCNSNCKQPTCACSGNGPLAQIVLLPGEREFIESRTRVSLPAGQWIIGQGPCLLLWEGMGCHLGYFRPIECHIMPVEVEFIKDTMPAIGISSSCSLKTLPQLFLQDRVHAWWHISNWADWKWQRAYNEAV